MGSKIINARAETVAEKTAFRDAFRKNRCLVVANGFFEWRREGIAKFPVYVRLKSKEPIVFAGLYSYGKSPESEGICTAAIITTDANDLLSAVHDRMPVILPTEKYDEWLNPNEKDKAKLLDLLKPYPSEKIEYYDVTLYVNKPEHDSPDVIEPMKRSSV
jgi:putative SOS response-associated peptidase YedK